MTDARADLESGDAAKIDAAHQRVETELHKIAEKLYKKESTGSEGGAPSSDEAEGSAKHADDDVIDAEFTQENDDS